MHPVAGRITSASFRLVADVVFLVVSIALVP